MALEWSVRPSAVYELLWRLNEDLSLLQALICNLITNENSICHKTTFLFDKFGLMRTFFPIQILGNNVALTFCCNHIKTYVSTLNSTRKMTCVVFDEKNTVLFKCM